MLPGGDEITPLWEVLSHISLTIVLFHRYYLLFVDEETMDQKGTWPHGWDVQRWDLKPSPYVWLFTWASSVPQLLGNGFRVQGKAGLAGLFCSGAVALGKGPALLPSGRQPIHPLCLWDSWASPPSEGCSLESERGFSSEAGMLSQPWSTGPAWDVPRPSHGMEGTPNFAACARILHKSDKIWVALLACVSAEEANHTVLK